MSTSTNKRSLPSSQPMANKIARLKGGNEENRDTRNPTAFPRDLVNSFKTAHTDQTTYNRASFEAQLKKVRDQVDVFGVEKRQERCFCAWWKPCFWSTHLQHLLRPALRASVLGQRACIGRVAQGKRGGGMRVLGVFENLPTLVATVINCQLVAT